MWLEAEKARNFNAVVWVLGEVNGYHFFNLFFNLLSDKSTDRRADITHSVMAVLRKDFIGFTRLPWAGGSLTNRLYPSGRGSGRKRAGDLRRWIVLARVPADRGPVVPPPVLFMAAGGNRPTRSSLLPECVANTATLPGGNCNHSQHRSAHNNY